MKTETALICTMLASPEDATAMLVYADWLHEQGPERAEEERKLRAEAEKVRSGERLVSHGAIVELARPRRGEKQAAKDARADEMDYRRELFRNWWSYWLNRAVEAEHGVPFPRSDADPLAPEMLTLGVFFDYDSAGGPLQVRTPYVLLASLRLGSSDTFRLTEDGTFDAPAIVTSAGAMYANAVAHTEREERLSEQFKAVLDDARAINESQGAELVHTVMNASGADALEMQVEANGLQLEYSGTPERMAELLRLLRENDFLKTQWHPMPHLGGATDGAPAPV